ncbi:MAG TPA: tetratricopeptide repeat protein, partial [Bryobacteraceae bacterium]|nr:tetratricopeptide repeat protein [Bryobacteraceae bacterium]
MILELALAAFALSATELYQHGIALFEKGDPQAAAHRFEEARALAPKDARIWRALGVSYAAMLDHQRATEPFRQACTLDPALTDACYYYGRNLYALNRFEPAIAALNKGMRAARSPWQVHLGLAQAYEGLGDAKQSEPAYRKAIAMFEAVPRQERGRPDFDPRLRLAIFLYRQGRADDALQWA